MRTLQNPLESFQSNCSQNIWKLVSKKPIGPLEHPIFHGKCFPKIFWGLQNTLDFNETNFNKIQGVLEGQPFLWITLYTNFVGLYSHRKISVLFSVDCSFFPLSCSFEFLWQVFSQQLTSLNQNILLVIFDRAAIAERFYKRLGHTVGR